MARQVKSTRYRLDIALTRLGLRNIEVVAASLFYQFTMYSAVRLAHHGFTLGELGLTCFGATVLFMEMMNLTIARVRRLTSNCKAINHFMITAMASHHSLHQDISPAYPIAHLSDRPHPWVFSHGLSAVTASLSLSSLSSSPGPTS